MSTIAHWLLGLWHSMYVPVNGPFYSGQVWGNVFVIAIVAPLGWLWSRTRFWPIRPVRAALASLHAKVDKHRAETAVLHNSVKTLHDRHDEHAAALAEHADLLAKISDRLDAGVKIL